MKYLANNILEIDILLLRYIFAWNGKKYIDKFFIWITRSGDGYLYPLIAALILILDSHAGYSILISGLTAFAFELPLYRILKSLVKRSRPFDKLSGIRFIVAPPDKFSFPSGHTAAAVIFAVILAAHFPVVTLPLAIWATLVGISRVYVGVHFPTDIIAGAILGILCAVVGLYVV